MRRTLLASLTSALCGVLFMVSGTFAGTVTTVTGTVLAPDGTTPVEGMAVQLFQDGSQVNYATTDSAGLFTFSYVSDGSYQVTFAPSYSYDCSSCALYQEISESVSIDSQENTVTEQDLGDYTMEAADRYVTITVVDENEAPVEGIYVSAWGNDSSWAYGPTDANGQYAFAWDSDIISFGVYPTDGGYTSTYQYDVAVEDSGETAITAEVQTTDATIAVNLQDENGDTYTLTESEYASVYCISTGGDDSSTAGGDGSAASSSHSQYFNGSILGGSSSTTIGVVAGTYNCGAWVYGYGVRTSGEITVESEATETLTVTLLEYDSVINFQYVDENGDPITDITSLSVYGSSTSDADGNDFYGDYIWAQGEDGAATLQALDGVTYEIGGWFDSNSGSGGHGDGEDEGEYSESGVYITSEGTNYIQSYHTTTVTADADEEQNVEVVLQEADATLEVTVLDADGNPSPYSWVSASEGSFASEGVEGDGNDWSNFVGGSADENGVATLYVVSGVDYTVYAWTANAFNSTVLPPPHQVVRVASGETESITMQEQTVDWTLNITATDDSETEFDYTYCYGYSPALGTQNFADLTGGTGTMGLVRGGDWYIGCMGYADETFYRSTDTIYTPGDEQGGSGELSVTLSSAGDYFSATSYTASATSATTFTLPDGVSTLTIPANAVADSGNYTLTVETATGYSVDDKNFPIAAFEFTIVDDSGTEITEFSSNLTLSLAYDEAALADWGIDEDSLTGGAYGENNDWQSPVSVTVDTENNLVVITLNHFSPYAILGDRGVAADEAPTKPRALEAKRIRRHRALLDWRKPAGDTSVTSYRVQLRKRGVTQVSKYRKFTGVTNTQRVVKNLKVDKRYQFRVRACNASSCSSWTKWDGFKTNP